MTLFDWLKCENIYAWVFSTKCSRKMEDDYPFPVGEKRGAIIKYSMGFLFLLVIIIIIWLPLLLFSLLNAIGERRIPDTFTATLELDGYPALFSMTARESYLRTPDENDAGWIRNLFASNKV